MLSGQAAVPRWRWQYRTLVTLVALTGAVLSARSVLVDGSSGLGDPPWLAVLFTVLVVVGELRPVRWLRRDGTTFIAPSWAFVAALLFTTEGTLVVAATMATSLVADVVRRRSPVRMVFHAGMRATAVAAGLGVLELLGHRATLADGAPLTSAWAISAVAGLLVIHVCAALLLAGARALGDGTTLRRILRRDAVVGFSTDGLLLTLGPVLAVLGRASPALLVPLLVTWSLVIRSGEIAAARQHEATHDPLTGLPNRRLFLERLREAVASRGAHSTGVLGVMIVDLDDFKEINDNLGHDVGDAVLIELGTRLRDETGPQAMVARLGGDEFALMASSSDPEGIRRLGQHVHDALGRPVGSNGFPLTISGSVGIAMTDPGQLPPPASKLMRRADVAMYSAKAAGTGVRVFGNDVDRDDAPGRLSLVSQLGSAIEAGELTVHYQPITDVRRGMTDRLEALVRWEHPTLGRIGPSDFVPMAEQTDLIGPLTARVIDEALRDCAGWIREGHDVGVAINVSARVLHDLRFPVVLADAARLAQLPPSAITLEITENSVLREPGRAARVLAELRALGVRVSVDDFGTGFSSLSSLRDLPLDELKIDRRFVGAILEDTDDEIIVRTVVALASQMGLSTVAEGAETSAIADRLLELGCDVLQGFHLARPMPALAVGEWLASRPRVVVLDPAPVGLSPSDRPGGRP